LVRVRFTLLVAVLVKGPGVRLYQSRGFHHPATISPVSKPGTPEFYFLERMRPPIQIMYLKINYIYLAPQAQPRSRFKLKVGQDYQCPAV